MAGRGPELVAGGGERSAFVKTPSDRSAFTKASAFALSGSGGQAGRIGPPWLEKR
jgi:hypothetical protein